MEMYRFLRPRGRRRIETCLVLGRNQRFEPVSSGREVGGGLKPIDGPGKNVFANFVSSGREVGGGLKLLAEVLILVEIDVSSGREVGGGLKRYYGTHCYLVKKSFLRPRGRRRIETTCL